MGSPGHLPVGGQLYRYARTRAAASAKLTTALAAFSEHRIPPPGRRTVADFLEDWLENTGRSPVRASTYEGCCGVVRRHPIPDPDRTRPSCFIPNGVQEMLNGKVEAGLSSRRADYFPGILHGAVNDPSAGNWWVGMWLDGYGRRSRSATRSTPWTRMR